jgi:uncharacterized protein (DUF4415 family)
MQHSGWFDEKPQVDKNLAYNTASDVTVMIDAEVVRAYQDRWPNWREKMAKVIKAASTKRLV